MALCGVLAFGVTQAASAAMITGWNYTATSGFTSYTGESTVYGEPTEGTIDPSRPNSAGTPSVLTWGGRQYHSSLSVTPDSQGSVATNGSTSYGALVHNNQPIPPYAKGLSSFVLNTSVGLVSSAPSDEAGFRQSIDNLSFNGVFKETPNEAPCVSGSQSICDDIFVLMDDNENTVDSLSQSFVHDGFKYLVTLGIDGIGKLSDDACTLAGADAGCVGFLTQEEKSNSFNQTLSISATPVASDIPEPGSIWMLGLGVLLAGLGVSRRRSAGAGMGF